MPKGSGDLECARRIAAEVNDSNGNGVFFQAANCRDGRGLADMCDLFSIGILADVD
jgi:hypothetical protein